MDYHLALKELEVPITYRAGTKSKRQHVKNECTLSTDKTLGGKDTCTLLFTASLFTTAKTW